MSKIVWDEKKGWHDGGNEVTVKLDEKTGRIVTAEKNDYDSIVSAQSDETLEAMLQAANAPCRDGKGNLRELTDDEQDFNKALRVEARKRGLR